MWSMSWSSYVRIGSDSVRQVKRLSVRRPHRWPHLKVFCFMEMQLIFAHIGIAAPSRVIETADLAILRGVLLRSDMLAAVSSWSTKW